MRGAEAESEQRGKKPMNNSLGYEVAALAHLLWHFHASPGDVVCGICRVELHLWN